MGNKLNRSSQSDKEEDFRLVGSQSDKEEDSRLVGLTVRQGRRRQQCSHSRQKNSVAVPQGTGAGSLFLRENHSQVCKGSGSWENESTLNTLSSGSSQSDKEEDLSDCLPQHHYTVSLFLCSGVVGGSSSCVVEGNSVVTLTHVIRR